MNIFGNLHISELLLLNLGCLLNSPSSLDLSTPNEQRYHLYFTENAVAEGERFMKNLRKQDLLYILYIM
jgi:hypothetical protein